MSDRESRLDATRIRPEDDSADATETRAIRAEDTEKPDVQAVGRFKVASSLGSGAFGDVYLAKDPQLEREVALKVPRKGAFREEEEARRFMTEAKSAAALQHPNICPVHEVFEEDDRLVIVMGYIRGKRLDQFIEPGKPLAARQAAKVVYKLARALQFAHDRGIIHRDLKPTNIIIDADRKEPVIMDFGLARREDSTDSALTRSGDILGSPAYMSPEQARGRVSEIGPHSDIYSLGVILYELLCGERPFGGSVAQVIGCIIHVDTPLPSTKHEGVDSGLETICLKAMSKQPDDRYASMQGFAQVLADWLKQSAKSTDDSQVESIPPAQPLVPPGETIPHADISALTATVAKPSDSEAPAVPDIQLPETQSLANRRLTKAGSLLPRSPVARWTLLGGLGAGLLLAVVLFTFRTPKGTVEITLSDPAADVTVEVDGSRIDLTADGKQFEFEVGEHQLKVTGNGFETVTKKFTIGKGNNSTVEVALRSTIPVAPSTPDSSESAAAASTSLAPLSGPEKELADFQSRVEPLKSKPASDSAVSKLRQEIWDFRFKHFGTPLANQAAEVASQLRWPTDDLKREDVVSYELSVAGGGDASKAPLEIVQILGDSRLRHTSKSRGIAFSPDGKWVASSGDDRRILIWDTSTGREINRWRIPGKMEKELVASTDGKTLITAAGYGAHTSKDPADREIHVWNPLTGELVETLDAHVGPVRRIALAANGRFLISKGYDPKALVWDTDSWQLVRTVAAEGYELGASPVGTVFGTGTSELNYVTLWDATTGQELRKLDETHANRGIVFNRDGTQVATISSKDDHVKVFRVDDGKLLLEIKDPHRGEDPVGAVFLDDQQQLATAGFNGEILIWDSKSGEKVKLEEPVVSTGSYHHRAFNDIAVSRDGRFMGTTRDDCSVRLFELPSFKPVLTSPDLADGFQYTDASDDGLRVATSSYDRRTTAWDFGPESAQRLVRKSWIMTRGIAVSASGNLVGAVEQDSVSSHACARAWSWDSLTLDRSVKRFWADRIALSADGTLAAISSVKPRAMYLYSMSTGQKLATFETDAKREAHLLKITPDGEILAMVYEGSTVVQLFDCDTGKHIRQMPVAHTEKIRTLDFSADGQQLATASYGKAEVKIWDWKNDRVLYDLIDSSITENEVGVAMARFSPDGRRLVTSHSGGNIRIWTDFEKPECRILKGNVLGDNPFDAFFTGDGRHITAVYRNGIQVLRLEDFPSGDGGAALSNVPVTENPAEAELRDLALQVDAVQEGTADSPAAVSLQNKLTDFRVQQFGTKLAVSTAGVMKRLQWPLDQMQRDENDAYELSVSTGEGSGDIVGIVGDSRLKHWGRYVRDVLFTPDGSSALSAGDDETIRIWNVETAREVRAIDTWPRSPVELALSKDAATVFAATVLPKDSTDTEYAVRRWNVADGEELSPLAGHSSNPRSVACSPDGRLVASGAENGTILVWDIETGKTEQSLNGHEGAASAIAFSPDSTSLVSGGADKSIRLWNLATGEAETIGTHDGNIRSVCFSVDGELIGSGSDDRSARVWDVAKRTEVVSVKDKHEIDGKKSQVSKVQFHPVEGWLVSGGYDGAVRYWDPQTGESKGGYLPRGDDRWSRDLYAFAFSEDGSRLVTGDDEGAVRIADLKTRSETHSVSIRKRGQTAGAFGGYVSPDGRRFVSSGRDSRLILIKPQSDSPPFALEDKFVHPKALAGSSDGVFVAAATHENVGRKRATARIWNLNTLKMERGITGMWPGCMALSPDRSRISIGGWDTDRVTIHDITTGEIVGSPFNGRKELRDIQFSADGERIATVDGGNRLVKIWDSSSQELLRTLDESSVPIAEVRFSSDGRSLYAVSSTSTAIRAWDPETFVSRTVECPDVNTDVTGFASIAVSPDCRVAALVTAGRSSIELRHLSDGKKLWTAAPPHAGCQIQDVFLTVDGRHVVSANRNATFYVYRLPESVSADITAANG